MEEKRSANPKCGSESKTLTSSFLSSLILSSLPYIHICPFKAGELFGEFNSNSRLFTESAHYFAVNEILAEKFSPTCYRGTWCLRLVL